MLYFSELKGKSVLTAQKVYVGVLDDIIFNVAGGAQVSKIVVKTASSDSYFVPITAVTKINAVVKIQDDAPHVSLDENELFVGKNINDQQIIDTTGSKLVRVNDVVFAQQPSLKLSGVDVGVSGILRWFGAEEICTKVLRLVGINLLPKFLSWADVAPLELGRGRVKMRKQDSNLERLKPEDLADHLEKLNTRNLNRVLGTLTEDLAAEVINNLNLASQTALFKTFDAHKSAKVLELLDDDESVDILLTLDRHVQESIIKLLSTQKRHNVQKLLSLPKSTIGNLVSLAYYAVSPGYTVREVRQYIKDNADLDVISSYVFVINDSHQVVGVFNMPELISQADDTPVYKFMIQNVAAIYLTTPSEIALSKMKKYNLNAIPVVDDNKKMVGVINWQDVSAT